MKKYISYLRVSTKQQERSGLGLEAQRAIIEHYVRVDKGVIVKEYLESESGKDIVNRPLLQTAITECKRSGFILCVAKLDRLSRDVEHIFQIKKQLGDLLMSCDLPSTDTLVLSVIAGMAQREREITSIRTKLALGAKKARGFKLGKPENLQAVHRAKGSAIAAEKTNDFRTDRKLTSMVESCVRDGMTHKELANELNNHGFLTYRKKPYNEFSAMRLVDAVIKNQ